MNKRDLIKALFKNPTIKALYESGQFNATDINRAILLESSESGARRARNEAIKDLPPAKQKEELVKRYNIYKNAKNWLDLAELHPYAKKKPDEGFEEWYETVRPRILSSMEGKIEEIEKVIAAAQGGDSDGDGYHDDEETRKQHQQASNNVIDTLSADEAKIDQDIEKKKQGSEGGEETGNDSSNSEETDDKIEELSSAFDQVFPDGLDFVKAPDMIGGINPYNYKEKGKPLIEKMRKAIVIDVLADKDVLKGNAKLLATRVFTKKINPTLEGAPEYITLANVVSEEFKNSLISAFDDIKNSFEERKGSIQPAAKKETEDNSQAIVKLDEFLAKANSKLPDLVGKYPKFKELLAVAYVKALKEKPKETATTPETPKPETSTATPSPPPATPASDTEEEATGMGESINRALSGIFLIENTGGDETSTASTEGGTEDTDPDAPTGQPVDVDEVPKMLAALKQLFKDKNLAIDVDEIWKLSQQKEEPEDKQDPSMDDESPPDIAEFNENWTEVLMTFFGKNPDRSSFMRRLLLRSQAQMLYGVMDVLEQISDPEQMSAYTDMNQDDEREKQADKAKEPELQKEGYLGEVDATEEEEREQQLKDAQRASIQKAVQDYTPEPKQKEEPDVQQDKVELPAKTRRIIKQDLQSMVDLLRQLKLAIKDYSMYATRKSADPRFDGSKLKANMDELLVQVQDDIYDLHSNLKPADLAPEPDGSIEEALNGIMLEEDDPERQAKIQLVRETYDNAKKEYVYVLMPSMEEPNWSKSQASAKKILDILKEEKFISLFPTGMKTAGGKVMTVGKAYESMTAVIQEFVKTVRNIVLISKEKYISRSSLTEAKNSLENISIEIAELFRVPSKFSPEEIKQAKEEEAATPANKALTTEPENKLEQKEGDNTTAAPAGDGEGTTEPPAGEEGEATEPPAGDEETTELPTQTFQDNQKAIEQYVKTNSAINSLKSDKAKESFRSFIAFLLQQIFKKPDTDFDDLNESFERIRTKFRNLTTDMNAVANKINKETGFKGEFINELSRALYIAEDSIFRDMTADELTNTTIQFIKNDGLFQLLFGGGKMAQAFESLVTVLPMQDEGTLERKKIGKESLPQEYLDKIANEIYPEAMSGKGLAPLLQKILKGELGQEAKELFSNRIKNTFTLTPKPSGFEPADTDVFDSYLFDPISQINRLSGLRSKYSKYISLYLANIYEEIKQPTALGSFTPSDFEAGYPNTPTADLNEDEFLESYEKLYNKFKRNFPKDMKDISLRAFVPHVMYAIKETKQQLEKIEDNDKQDLLNAFQEPEDNPILKLSAGQVSELAKTIAKHRGPSKKSDSMEEALKPIIEKMLKEHYNY